MGIVDRIIALEKAAKKFAAKLCCDNQFTVMAADPTTSDIQAGFFKIVKNTTTGTVKLWVNDAGTLKSVTLS